MNNPTKDNEIILEFEQAYAEVLSRFKNSQTWQSKQFFNYF